MNVGMILGVVESGLELLNKIVPDQATKIANQIKSLRERWDHEISKADKRDDAMLDCIELELRDICQLFSSAIKQASSSDKLK